ncbi:helix-turn-helix domain-containing protein [Geobacillus sp. 46C-IIa]|nr:helix-turn-helix domain-containing protein [Geobacillus sp. 46C-IIa]
MLRYLLENAPKVKRYDAIIANVWGDEEAVRNENVKKMINKLRKKLEQCFSEPTDQIIVNVRGEGYLWNCKIPYRIIVCLDEYEYFI